MAEQAAQSVQEQLVSAARDLWSMVQEAGENHVVFVDRRSMQTRVERLENGLYQVSWECEDDSWTVYERQFESPREAAFHGYQGPHA